MYWICDVCGCENECSNEGRRSPCVCCGAPAPSNLGPGTTNHYRKAYLLLKNVECGDSDAKKEAVRSAIQYLKDHGISETEAYSVISMQANMLGWEKGIIPVPEFSAHQLWQENSEGPWGAGGEIETPSGSHSSQENDSETPYKEKPNKWIKILKGLSKAQIVVSFFAFITIFILLISEGDWYVAVFLLVHIGIIYYEVKHTPEVKRPSIKDRIWGAFLLLLSAFSLLSLIAAVTCGDFYVTATLLGPLGTPFLLAQEGLEGILGYN